MNKKVVNIDRNTLREMVAKSLKRAINEWGGDIDYNPDPKESMSMLKSVLSKKMQDIVDYLQEANACYQRRDIKGMNKWNSMAMNEAQMAIEDIDNNWNDGDDFSSDAGRDNFAFAGALNEMGNSERGQYDMGRLYKRKKDNGDHAGSTDVADHALNAIEDECPNDLESPKHRKLLNSFHDGMGGLKQGTHSKFMGLDKDNGGK